ncbi:hypothetical protein ACPPVT_09160 [Angustibacter sp. McL0619]|uniref:hypothetical protein n=1 Tax=Angustibacter sp. McL0619 TaxID=3415676 RepID=UPI003CF568C4
MTQFPQPEPQDQAAQQHEPATSAEVQPAADLDLPHTGDDQVDEALERLLVVPDLPPADQVEVYVGVHRNLQDRLADLEG